MSLTSEQVVAAYRIMLGRDAEGVGIIEQLRAEHATAEELRAALVARSPEFAAEIRRFHEGAIVVGRHQTAPPIRVELDGPRAQLDRMLDRVASSWVELGDTEPHWSVLVAPEYRSDQIAGHEARFYETGFHTLANMRTWFERNGCDLGSVRNALELGCGVGRVTHPLATVFETVDAFDVSASHLKIAGDHLRGKGVSNATLHQLRSVRDLDRLPRFDFFFSVIVLQHNPPPVIALMLDRIFAALEPGGYAFFQVPTYGEGYRFVWSEYLETPGGGMEMHVLPQREVFRILHRHGLRIVEVQEDGWAGSSSFVSCSFLVRKTRTLRSRARRWLGARGLR